MSSSRPTAASRAAFDRARGLIPGGVNSPVRAFRAVGGDPAFIDHGDGSHIYDIDGNAYIDYVLSWGPLILGHAHPAVVHAATAAIRRGTSFGAPTEAETTLARLIVDAVPGVEMIRLVNSGTEATMSALRLARAATGRDMIVKFAGCYHGHADMLLVQAGSGVATLGLPDSPGVPRGATESTLVAPYNDLAAVEELFAQHGDQIAAVIVEPVAGNMGMVLPVPGFLGGLRQMTRQAGALLIVDEVMTGFRVHPAGAIGLYGLEADIVCLGKVVGGGFPLAAYGGRRSVMDLVAPAGAVYQAGTLSGNPVATAAGIAQLQELARPGLWQSIADKATALVSGMNEIAARQSLPFQATAIGTMAGYGFTDQPVRNYADARRTDNLMFRRFFRTAFDRGVAFAPSAYESLFLSAAHTDDDIAQTLTVVDEAMAVARRG